MSYRSSRSNLVLASLVVGFVATLATTSHGDAPVLSLTHDGRLNVAEIARDAPTTLQLTSENALPITWSRGNHREGTLPLVLLPGAPDPIVVTLQQQPKSIVLGSTTVPRISIDARAYEKVATWRPTASPADRRRTLVLATLFATTILLVALLQRGRAIAIFTLVAAWTIGLAIAANQRPRLLVHDEPDGTRWILAARRERLAIPIRPGERWLPTVESPEHLTKLALQIHFDGPTPTLTGVLHTGMKIKLTKP